MEFDEERQALLRPERLWSAGEVLGRPGPVPAVPGVYGWRFDMAPFPGLPTGELLYVGIAPRRMAVRTSRQSLRSRVRYHFRGNAEGSTLRLTLGCLLGLELRRVGSGRRMTFRASGEAELSAWMARHARVCWVAHPRPWLLESALISGLDLPLNLDQNRHNAFHPTLKALRAAARQRARERPIAS
ncbi:GIY-YIG nuclease family protein [Streptomyces sp. NPDC059853]|uniref:GIY-YIG nuclease family protein n=1 Tax=Streptomyces sp. NPDC059853 TaxID=3346973 RepID=UPI0036464A22